MVIWVVEYSREGCKIIQILCQKSTSSQENIVFCTETFLLSMQIFGQKSLQRLWRKICHWHKCPFYDHFQSFFFGIYMNIFNKTSFCDAEMIQKLCQKYTKTQKMQKTEREILVQCVITFEPIKMYTCSAPQNDRLNFSFAKQSGQKGSEHTHLSVANFG